MNTTSEWQEIALQDLATEITVGFVGPMATEYVPSGIPFLRSLNVEPHRINRAELMYVSESFHQRIKKSTLAPGDVVIVRTGKPGTAAVIPDNLPIANCSDLVIVRPGPQLDSKFLSYYINSAAQNHVYAHTVGAVQQHFNVGSAKTLKLLKPPLPEQRAIAHILGALDDKIELNRRMNRTLEAMAQALFRSWFVDFDPVIAKHDERKPVGMNDAISALFPEHFQNSETGPIPMGWRIEKVEDCIVRHGIGKKYEQKTALASGEVPILDQGRSGIIGYHNDAPGVEASEDNPIIVFANHTCYMRLITFPFSAIQNVLPFTGKNLDTVWTFFATEGLQEFLEYKGHWPDFVINKIVVPPEELTKAFGDVARNYIKRMRQNEVQNETLTNIRDTLLPQLLSGELRVGQAEKIIGEA